MKNKGRVAFVTLIVFFALFTCLLGSCSSATDSPLKADLKRMLGNSFSEVIRDLHMKDLYIIERKPEVYQAVKGINDQREEIYLYVRSSEAVRTLQGGVAKPSSFFKKTVAGIAYKQGRRWVSVGTGHFRRPAQR